MVTLLIFLQTMARCIHPSYEGLDHVKNVLCLQSSAGFLNKRGDEISFVNAFKMLVKSNYQENSKAALDLIENELSAEIMSKKYQSIYKELLDY